MWTISAGAFKVFYEYQFNPTNGSSVPFTFNSAHGDRVYLSQSDAGGNLTGYRAVAKFGAAANGFSFGRYTNSAGAVEFVAMSRRSFGVEEPVGVTTGTRLAVAIYGKDTTNVQERLARIVEAFRYEDIAVGAERFRATCS